MRMAVRYHQISDPIIPSRGISLGRCRLVKKCWYLPRHQCMGKYEAVYRRIPAPIMLAALLSIR
jgi:hypothetical protein